ncbi:DUF4235 domain-containing protein [Gardnerella sp. 2492-Sm]|uniref:DUF4235 domain-containing protein n=1 Tax=unclassified Gardnerella TaxID=2628112 RepID=UPI003D01AB6B
MTQLSSANNKSAHSHLAAQAAVQQLNATNRKIDALRERRLKNQNTLGDSLLKHALPSFATFMAGQLAHLIWKKNFDTKKTNLRSNKRSNNLSKEKIAQKKQAKQEEPLLMALGFAVFSAIITTLVGRFVGRGTSSYIAHRQRKRQFRKNKF